MTDLFHTAATLASLALTAVAAGLVYRISPRQPWADEVTARGACLAGALMAWLLAWALAGWAHGFGPGALVAVCGFMTALTLWPAVVVWRQHRRGHTPRHAAEEGA